MIATLSSLVSIALPLLGIAFGALVMFAGFALSSLCVLFWPRYSGAYDYYRAGATTVGGGISLIGLIIVVIAATVL